MKTTYRNTILALLGLLVFALGGFLFYFREARLPSEGQLEIASLQRPVEILSDAQGFRHISAANAHDLFLALGYLHASRDIQYMDRLARAATGRLSEAFGADFLDIDRFCRLMKFHQKGKQFCYWIDLEVHDILTAYCQGINTYIQQNRYRLPRSFKRRHYQPLSWDCAVCLAVQRLLAWQQSSGWIKSILFYKMLEIYGTEKLQSGFPLETGWPSDNFPHYGTRFFAVLDEFFQNAALLNALFDDNPPFSTEQYGRPARTDKGITPLLYGRTSWPGNTYQIVELECPAYHAAGVTILGIPLIIKGFNATIGWNLNPCSVNDFQVFVLPYDHRTGKYRYQGHELSPETHHEMIPIDKQRAQPFLRISTILGPVISDLSSRDTLSDILSIQWSGHKFSDEFKALLDINRATGWSEFHNASAALHIPGILALYADPSGTIGLSASIPSDGEYDRSATLPTIYKTDVYINREPYPTDQPISVYPEPGNFIILNKYPADSLELVQDSEGPPTDSTIIRQALHPMDPAARLYLPLIAEAIPDSTLNTTLAKRVRANLMSWDLTASNDKIAPTIWNTLIWELCRAIYADEMNLVDQNLFERCSLMKNRLIANALTLVQQGESDWFDNIHTPRYVERRNDVLLKAFHQTITGLSEAHTQSIMEWEWNRVYPNLEPVNDRIILQLQPRKQLYQFSQTNIQKDVRAPAYIIMQTDRDRLLSQGAHILMLHP